MNQVLKEIGAELKAAREEQKLELAVIADRLKIRYHYLLALENGDSESLANAYIIGYLGSYAKEVGLDPRELIRRYGDGEKQVPHANNNLSLPPVPEKTMRPTPYIVVFSIFLAVAVVSYYQYRQQSRHTDALSKPAPAVEETAKEEKAAAPKEAEVKATPETAAEPEKGHHDTAVIPEEESVETGTPLDAAATETTPVEPTVAPEVNLPEMKEEVISNMGIPEIKEEEAPQAKPQDIQYVLVALLQGQMLEPSDKIVFVARKSTWIQLFDDKQQFLLEKKLRPGDSFTVPDQQGLLVKAANLTDIDVFERGKKNRFMGAISDIIIPVQARHPVSTEEQLQPGQNVSVH